jgi:hypothetical protein
MCDKVFSELRVFVENQGFFSQNEIFSVFAELTQKPRADDNEKRQHLQTQLTKKLLETLLNAQEQKYNLVQDKY